MRDLVSTTCQRAFDKKIILKYLNSKSAQDQNAALISIANSNDTSFIPLMIAKQFKQKEYLFFALGKLGPSTISADHIIKNLSDNLSSSEAEQAFSAIGRCGDSSSLNLLINKFENSPNSNPELGLAFYYFQKRNIINRNCAELIIRELQKLPASSSRLSMIFFAISRMNVDSIIAPKLNSFMREDQISALDSTAFHYYATCLRKYKFSIPAKDFFRLFFANGQPRSIESIKCLSLVNFCDDSYFPEILRLIEHPYLLFGYQTAISLSELQLNQSQKLQVIDQALQIIKSDRLDPQVRFQTLKSILKLDPSFSAIVLSLGADLPFPLRFDLLTESANIRESDLDQYLNELEKLNRMDRSRCIPSLYSFRKKENLKNIIDYHLTKMLHTEMPDFVSMIFDNADADFLSTNRSELINFIPKFISNHLNDAAYSDAFFSIRSIASENFAGFQHSIDSLLSLSQIPSIQKKFNQKSSHSEKIDLLLNQSFKFSKARISTNRGEITVQFNHSLAPLSCANFIDLAERSFFNSSPFHRIVPGFVLQGGDPTGSGSGGPGYEIVTETVPAHYSAGTVGMARSELDTEGSQWFITTDDYFHLDGNYTIFGNVIAGYSTALNILPYDYIKRIDLIK